MYSFNEWRYLEEQDGDGFPSPPRHSPPLPVLALPAVVPASLGSSKRELHTVAIARPSLWEADTKASTVRRAWRSTRDIGAFIQSSACNATPSAAGCGW